MRSFGSRLLAIALLLLFAPAAWAYLDPASGSMILQVILGGIAGLAVTIKLFWHRILGFFGRSRRDDEPEA